MLFQPQLEVADIAGAAIFLERRAALPAETLQPDGVDEASSLRMLYRRQLDYAVGAGTAVEWSVPRSTVGRASCAR